MICSHPFESQMNFSDPQQIIKTDDGEMPYGIFRYQQIIDESYIIKNTHIGVLECDSMEDMMKNNNPHVMMDPIIQRLSNEKDTNNTFSLARGEKL